MRDMVTGESGDLYQAGNRRHLGTEETLFSLAFQQARPEHLDKSCEQQIICCSRRRAMYSQLLPSWASVISTNVAMWSVKYGIATSALMLVSTAAMAGSLVYDDASTCTTNNCSSIQVNGVASVASISGGSEPFVTQIFASSGECLRVDVDVPNDPLKDLEAVVVGPEGTVWRNDDRSGSADRRPLVKIASTPAKGWYTIQIAHFNAQANNYSFTFRYGRYNSGNSNCSSAIAPLAGPLGSAFTAVK